MRKVKQGALNRRKNEGPQRQAKEMKEAGLQMTSNAALRVRAIKKGRRQMK
jgi:hypothetical protein